MAKSRRTPCRGGICAQTTLTERAQMCKHLREDERPLQAMQREEKEGSHGWTTVSERGHAGSRSQKERDKSSLWPVPYVFCTAWHTQRDLQS